jgi:hypothetical protein
MSYVNAVLFTKRDSSMLLARVASRLFSVVLESWEANASSPLVGGRLDASPISIATWLTVHDTGYLIKHGIEVAGRVYELPDRHPQRAYGLYGRKDIDFLALLEGKAPGFIEFGTYGPTRLFKQAMDVAAEFAGRMYFAAVTVRASDRENPVKCHVSISENEALRVRLYWYDDPTLVDPVLNFCRVEGFAEEPGWLDHEKPRQTA